MRLVKNELIFFYSFLKNKTKIFIQLQLLICVKIYMVLLNFLYVTKESKFLTSCISFIKFLSKHRSSALITNNNYGYNAQNGKNSISTLRSMTYIFLLYNLVSSFFSVLYTNKQVFFHYASGDESVTPSSTNTGFSSFLNAKENEYSSSIFSSFMSEKDAYDFLFSDKSADLILDNKDFEYSIRNGWWNVAKNLILKAHDERKDFSRVVRSSVGDMRKNLDEVIRLLNKQHNDITEISPSFQWAESPQFIFLNIKFSYRWSSPGALSVENEEIRSSNSSFYFSGVDNNSGIKKKFILKLDLLEPILPDGTKWSFSSVGKVSVTLQKQKAAIWGRLTKSKNKIPNMQIWFDMKAKHQSDIDTFKKTGKLKEEIDEEENNLKEEENKEEKQTGKNIEKNEKEEQMEEEKKEEERNDKSKEKQNEIKEERKKIEVNKEKDEF